jgi:hypothetical protein
MLDNACQRFGIGMLLIGFWSQARAAWTGAPCFLLPNPDLSPFWQLAVLTWIYRLFGYLLF